jgi:hypothetical protein
MSNAAVSIIMGAIHSAFESYPRGRRSRLEKSQLDHAEECAHLTRAIRALDGTGADRRKVIVMI